MDTQSGSSESSEKGPVGRCWKRFKRIFKTLGLHNLKPFLIVGIYSLIGAGCFIALEKDYDIEQKVAALEERHLAREKLIERFRNMEVIEAIAADFDRPQYMLDSVLEFEKDLGVEISIETSWDFWNALLYAGSVYTTIGYGVIACATVGGQVLTIFYAMIGIPLVLTALNDLGKFLLKTIKRGSDFTIFLFSGNWIPCLKNFRKRDNFQGTKPTLLSTSPELARSRMAVFNPEGDIYPKDPRTGKDLSSEQLSPSHDADVEIGIADEEDADEEEDDLQEQEYVEVEDDIQAHPPVLAAVIVTISWLFVCSGIFVIWEDWTYWTSFYFFFVSLSTIGFGDVYPAYPQFMIMNFGLVLVGLALVSVCINVVQQKIENLYMMFLLSLLGEYQKMMELGQGELHASVGMTQMWNQNKKVKWLMPLLGKNKRKVVMQKFQDEAKAQGIELPTAFTDLDPSGLPAVLNVEEEKLEKLAEKHEESELQKKPKPELVETGVQVRPLSAHFDMQTDILMLQSVLSQTSLNKIAEQEQQTYSSVFDLREAQSQTRLFEVRESPMQTHSSLFQLREAMSQTHIAEYRASEMQTHSSLALLRESGSQTNIKEYQERPMQTRSSIFQLREGESQTLYQSAHSITQTPISAFNISQSESQTNVADFCSEMESQTGISAFRRSEYGSQTFTETSEHIMQHGSSIFDLQDVASGEIVETGEAPSQTAISAFAQAEFGSQTLYETTEKMMQHGSSVFDLQDVSSFAGPETEENITQTALSSFRLQEFGSQTIYETAEQTMQHGSSVFDFQDVGSAAEVQTEEIPSQTAISAFAQQEFGSQTLYETSEQMMQHGSSVFDLQDVSSLATAETEENITQTAMSSFAWKEFGSQTIYETAEQMMQHGSSTFDLIDAEAAASAEIEEMDTQTAISAFQLRESESQTAINTGESAQQTANSFFNLREAPSQTFLELSEQEMQTIYETDEMESQTFYETSEKEDQTGSSYFALRHADSQTFAQTDETQTQTRQSFFDLREGDSQTFIEQAQEETQTAEKERASLPTQTLSSIFRMAHVAAQVAVVQRTGKFEDKATQAGVLARIEQVLSSKEVTAQEKDTSEVERHVFRTPSLKKTGYRARSKLRKRGESLIQSDDESHYDAQPPKRHPSSEESSGPETSAADSGQAMAAHGRHVERQKSVKSLSKRFEKRSTQRLSQTKMQFDRTSEDE